MKTPLGLILWAMVIVSDTPPIAAEVVAYDSAIGPYVAFLKEQKQTAVDYVLSLFDRYDIVVLCERVHPEITQYDLIYDLVSTPRFQREVGNVFTEVGTVALRSYVESFLTADHLSDEQVNGNLRHIAKNIGWIGIWEETNFYEFLKRVYSLNGSLPPERRVHVYPSDIEFDWKGVTKESWGKFTKEKLPHRDRILAENVISGISEGRNGANRAKALVIMNYRHAFPHLNRQDDRWGSVFSSGAGSLTTMRFGMSSCWRAVFPISSPFSSMSFRPG